ncbi:MAG: KamA family radical SAM protein [Deltaproteobacteria bacterium]|nr:KamA family radical SAM protein [Deltaproteobacteria bacterium]
MRRPPPDPSREGTPWASVSPEDFADWGWQIRNRVDTLGALEQLFALTPEERCGFGDAAPRFRFAISPYYALLADPEDPDCPIRRQVVPRPEESLVAPGERADPLGEEEREAAPNLIHRYRDRALLLATDRCPVYCRFCTRRRIVGRTERQTPRDLLGEAFGYVRAHPEIKDVIVSGGDALMLGDHQLDYVLRELRSIEHVEIIRVATRMPVTCPMRVTETLADILAKYAPVYVMTHFNHAREVTESAWNACGRFVDRGVVVYNQSVLLRGINDRVDTIAELNRALVAMRVTPYYLHQCDLAEGIEHFRTPLAAGIEIIDGLRGHVSGLAVPQLCVDVPGGLGKVTVQPSWIVGRRGRITTFRTYTGETADYLDP